MSITILSLKLTTIFKITCMGKKLLCDLFIELSTDAFLQDNHVVKVLIKHCRDIDFSKRENCFEDIQKFYQTTQRNIIDNYPDLSSQTLRKDDKLNDYRIKRMEVKHIKCFAESEEGLPYGVTFEMNEKPVSTIIYGTNGVGKSALFGAMEYVYCKHVSEFALRNHDTDLDWLAFLAHNGISKNASCEIETSDKKLTINETNYFEESSYFARNCFINETQVNLNGKIDYNSWGDCSAHRLIANGLGLKEIVDVMIVFSKLSVYNRQKERRDYTSANIAVNQSRTLLEEWNNQIIEIKAKLESLNKLEITKTLNNKTEQVSNSVSKILGNRLVLDKNANQLESHMRDFLSAYQKWNDVENFALIEHRFKMINHAKHLIGQSDSDGFCPLCNSSVNLKGINESLTLQMGRFKEQLVLKEVAQNTMEAFFDQLDQTALMCNNFITSANDIVVQLSNFSPLKHCVDAMKRISTLISGYRDSAHFCELISIRNSGDRTAQLSRFLYFELERIITLSNSIFERSDSMLNEFYSELEDALGGSVTEEDIDLAKQVGILEREMDYLVSQASKERLHLASLNEVAYQTKQKYDLQVSIIEQIRKIEPILQKAVNKRVVNMFLPIKDAIEEILEDFLTDDNVNIEISCAGDFISIYIITADGVHINPAMYFNTFRYKLFSTALSLALVLITRDRVGLNLPIVFDDPFLGFDTTDRDRMVSFARKMAIIIGRYATPIKPIQVISFTHNWQLFQILRSALQPIPSIKFLILDSYKNARKVDSYYELARQV